MYMTSTLFYTGHNVYMNRISCLQYTGIMIISTFTVMRKENKLYISTY